MTQEKVKKLLPIIQAFAEGKTIEYNCKGNWIEHKNFSFTDEVQNYRIKPISKYRPFKDAEECWQEMRRHQPFGWIKDKEIGDYEIITRVNDKENIGFMAINSQRHWTLEGLMDFYTFADGTPFGIREE